MARVSDETIDLQFAAALQVAATSVAPGAGDKTFLEKRLASALGEALEAEFAPLSVSLNKKLVGITLEEWNPQPGAFDVAILKDDSSPLVVAEIR